MALKSLHTPVKMQHLPKSHTGGLIINCQSFTELLEKLRTALGFHHVLDITVKNKHT